MHSYCSGLGFGHVETGNVPRINDVNVFECPAFSDIRRGFQHLFEDSHGAMRLLMWHPCQKDVASCLLRLLNRIDETLT